MLTTLTGPRQDLSHLTLRRRTRGEDRGVGKEGWKTEKKRNIAKKGCGDQRCHKYYTVTPSTEGRARHHVRFAEFRNTALFKARDAANFRRDLLHSKRVSAGCHTATQH